MPVVGFFTHSTTMPAGTDRNKSLYQEWAGRCLPAFETAAQNKKYLLVDVFHCQSSATLPIELFIHAKIIPDKNEWKTYKKEMRTHPNKTDFGDAQQFALKMVNLI